MAMTAAAVAGALASRRNAEIKHRSSDSDPSSSSSYDGFYRETYWRTEGVFASGHIYRNNVLLSTVEVITITCLNSLNRDVHALRKRLVLPSSFEELKHVGMQIYGATFYRVLLDNGAEIDDIRVVRNGDLVVFAEETNARDTITISCLETGDVAGKLLVVPRTFEELKQVGVKMYGAHFARVLDEEGNEINDVQVLRNGDRVVYASQKLAEESNERTVIMLTITCLEKGDSEGRLLVLPHSLREVKQVGENIYGAHFVRVLNEEGNEISGIGMLRDGDRVDYTSDKWAKESNTWIMITIACLEKGDIAGKLLLLPCSLVELKQIGVKIYGAIFVIVLDEEGVEINDIQMLRNGDRVNFARQKRVEKSHAHKRAKETNTRKRVEGSHAQKWAKESNTRKRVGKSNASVKITCFAPIMKVMKGWW